MKKIIGILFLLTLNLGFAITIDEIKIREELYPKGLEKELQENLNFFKDGVGVDPVSKMPQDTITVKGGDIDPGMYTNTTVIGLYLNLLTEMSKAGNEKAVTRINEVLDQLIAAPHWNGLFYWPFEFKNGEELTPAWDEIIPSVDNANLSFALAGVAGAFLDSNEAAEMEIVRKTEEILDRQNPGWAKLYDKNRGLLRAGWSGVNDKPLAYWIDRMANESRLAPLWAALAVDEIPEEVFSNMELYRGNYKINNKTYEPILTWDGSFFQAMLPSIWLNEEELISDHSMITDHYKMQVQYAAKNKIPALVSASATVDDEYLAFGAPLLSESAVKFKNPIHVDTTGTPHATALAYIVDKENSVEFLKNLRKVHPGIATENGWYDAINSNGQIGSKMLGLDHGMFVGSFLHEEINKDVEKYLVSKGYYERIEKMYESFKAN